MYICIYDIKKVLKKKKVECLPLNKLVCLYKFSLHSRELSFKNTGYICKSKKYQF